MSNFDPVRQPILRLWCYADAPQEFREALVGERKDYWVAHASPDLMQEEVVALFQVWSMGTATIRIVRLPDGSGLFTVPFPVHAPSSYQKAETGGVARVGDSSIAVLQACDSE